jgi:enediyne biosynthesis protein E4
MLLPIVPLIALLALSACQATAPARSAGAPRPANALAVAVQSAPLATPAACSGTFVARDLDHTTTTPGATARMFEGNGSGVAIDDLDGDGRPEIVLANSYGPNTILWNQGELALRAERMPQGDARAVNLVDVDGDGLLDMVFTRRQSAPSYWRNRGAGRFEQELLPNVARPAYAMAWGDLDGDGALDLVAGSYDAELLNGQGNSFLLGSGAGVYLYQRRGASYSAQQLARKSQALALALADLDGDGRRDILVGNDFALPDQAWLNQAGGWIAAEPFAATSHSTMSFDTGDIDNDGRPDLFATDMKPYDTSAATLATWLPMMREMFSPPQPGDRQITENVLQVGDGRSFRNQAYARGVSATGWSWSGEFGDLDNDGALDLYVANGMIEAELFRYLPNGELIEQNRALRNDGAGNFAPAPGWGLGSARSGRGMSIADLDGDGDLDIVVNNLRAPAQLFENRLCGGSSLEVDLRWPASKNTRALGATLVLHTSAGDYTREVRAGAGYLSGAPARIHVGFPASAKLEWLELRWPDGAVSAIDAPAPHALLMVTRK